MIILTNQSFLTALGTGTETFYIVVIAIVLVLVRVLWRTFANYKGLKFSLAKTIAYSCVYVGLGIFFSVLSFVQGVTTLFALPEIALAALTALWSYEFTDRRISFWNDSYGSLYFKGGISIYLIYIVGIVARFLIDIVFIGPSMFSFASGVVLTGNALYGSMVADMLVMLGVGLLMGRSIRVANRYSKIQRGEEQIPTVRVS